MSAIDGLESETRDETIKSAVGSSGGTIEAIEANRWGDRIPCASKAMVRVVSTHQSSCWPWSNRSQGRYRQCGRRDLFGRKGRQQLYFSTGELQHASRAYVP